jgi:galactose mutarotase-like enzyme
MAVCTTKQEQKNRSYREPSEFSAPQYAITYGSDHTLQWEPSVGSKELAVALSYHFPLQTDLESKMQAATRKFLREEDLANQDPSRETAVPMDTKDTCLETQSTSPALQIFTWDSEMKEYSPKAKRRRYDTKERVKVAQNRGFACEQHRRMKMKVG